MSKEYTEKSLVGMKFQVYVLGDLENYICEIEPSKFIHSIDEVELDVSSIIGLENDSIIHRDNYMSIEVENISKENINKLNTVFNRTFNDNETLYSALVYNSDEKYCILFHTHIQVLSENSIELRALGNRYKLGVCKL